LKLCCHRFELPATKSTITCVKSSSQPSNQGLQPPNRESSCALPWSSAYTSSAPTSIAAAFLLTDLVPLFCRIHGERTSAWATHKDQGGVAHDSVCGRRALLYRLKVVGMSPSLSLDRLLPLRAAKSIECCNRATSPRGGWGGGRASSPRVRMGGAMAASFPSRPWRPPRGRGAAPRGVAGPWQMW
jgi:hypothetical protein